MLWLLIAASLLYLLMAEESIDEEEDKIGYLREAHLHGCVETLEVSLLQPVQGLILDACVAEFVIPVLERRRKKKTDWLAYLHISILIIFLEASIFGHMADWRATDSSLFIYQETDPSFKTNTEVFCFLHA